ncbi:IS3 family transposase [Caldifermentibacillus hisashii]|uniref:IS3 family transposase n=1 Tax=Caldifermentibacillus hisashii TaxID=996558 RepID=UPI003424D54B
MLKSLNVLINKKKHSIQTMCDVLDVPRSTYYKSFDKTISNRDQENHKLTERIIEIHNESDKRYDASKIHHLLSEEGYYVSLKRVQRLMKKAGVKSITVKSFDQRQVRKRS